MTARLGQVTLIITIIAVGYFIYASVQGSIKSGLTINNTTSSLQTGLVLHYTFDGGDTDWSSTTKEILDVSGYDHHANVDESGNSPTQGVIGQGLYSRGDSWAGVYMATTSALELGTGDMSIGTWVRIEPGPADNNEIVGIFHHFDSAGYQFYYSTTSDHLILRLDDGAGHSKYAYSDSSLGIYDSGWHYIMVVIDRDSGAYFYLDGNDAGSYGISEVNGYDISDPTAEFVALRRYGDSTLKGDVDDFRMYNRALTADEVQQLYNMGAGNKVGKTITSAGLETGLVGHWTFDGPDMDWGSTTAEVQDVSGNGYNGNATTSMSAAKSPTEGVIGQAMNFDGVDDFMDPGTNFGQPTTLTTSLWLKTSFSGSPHIILNLGNQSPPTNPTSYVPVLGLFSDGTLRAEYWTGGHGNITTTQSLNDGQWHHVAFIGNDTSQSLYVDGAFVGSRDGTITLSFWNYTQLGVGYDSGLRFGGTGWEYFNGTLDDVRIYNRALSADEVAQLYSMGGNKLATTVKPPPLEVGLVGHWTFDGPDMTRSTSTDVSGNGNDGALNGSARPVAGAVGQALYFDGTGDYIDLGNKAAWEPAGSESFSVSFWYQGLKGSSEYFISHSPQSLTNFWYITNAQAQFCGGANCGKVVTSAYTLPSDNGWHHVTVVLDRSPSPDTLTTYIDGVEADQSTGTLDGNTTVWGSNTRIGTGYWITSSDRKGAMDDVRIYKKALSADEVQQLYNMGR